MKYVLMNSTALWWFGITAGGAGGALPDQLMAFGASTLVGAGAFRPVDGAGARVEVASISGNTTGYEVAGGSIVRAASGAPIHGQAMVVTTTDGRSCALTLDLRTASTGGCYSAATLAEMRAANIAAKALGRSLDHVIQIRDGALIEPNAVSNGVNVIQFVGVWQDWIDYNGELSWANSNVSNHALYNFAAPEPAIVGGSLTIRSDTPWGVTFRHPFMCTHTGGVILDGLDFGWVPDSTHAPRSMSPDEWGAGSNPAWPEAREWGMQRQLDMTRLSTANQNPVIVRGCRFGGHGRQRIGAGVATPEYYPSCILMRQFVKVVVTDCYCYGAVDFVGADFATHLLCRRNVTRGMVGDPFKPNYNSTKPNVRIELVENLSFDYLAWPTQVWYHSDWTQLGTSGFTGVAVDWVILNNRIDHEQERILGTDLDGNISLSYSNGLQSRSGSQGILQGNQGAADRNFTVSGVIVGNLILNDHFHTITLDETRGMVVAFNTGVQTGRFEPDIYEYLKAITITQSKGGQATGAVESNIMEGVTVPAGVTTANNVILDYRSGTAPTMISGALSSAFAGPFIAGPYGDAFAYPDLTAVDPDALKSPSALRSLMFQFYDGLFAPAAVNADAGHTAAFTSAV